MKKSIALLFCLCLTLAVFCPGIVSANSSVDASCQACHDAGFGDGTLHGIHTGQACNICHASASGGDSPVATSKCIVCHPVGNVGLCPLADAHEALGQDCLTCHAPACEAQATVAIEPATATLNPGDTQIFEASTTGGDNTPAYTWEVQGGTAGTGNTTTGDSIEYTAGDTPGNYTITVTDTANGNVQATAAVTIEAEVTCTVTVLDEQHAKSHWVALPALIRIQTTGFEVSQATEVTFTSEADGALNSVIPLVKLVIPGTGTINQFAIIPPALLTGNFDAESETITVAVEGCAQTDTLELKLLSFGPIPLGK